MIYDHQVPEKKYDQTVLSFVLYFYRKWTPEMDSVVVQLHESIDKEIQTYFDDFQKIVLEVGLTLREEGGGGRVGKFGLMVMSTQIMELVL